MNFWATSSGGVATEERTLNEFMIRLSLPLFLTGLKAEGSIFKNCVRR